MSELDKSERVFVTNPRPEHFKEIQELCKRVYPFSKPWSIAQLESHLAYFPDGQLIAIDRETNSVVGLAFSLIVLWDDYTPQDSWGDFTSSGFFHNHNPKKGQTLYGAEVMVDPNLRGQGIGRKLYEGRVEIATRYNLKRIRAGARLRGYSKHADKLSPYEYTKAVAEKKIYDPTLSFQIGRGFVVLDVAKNYLYDDPESLGHAAVIEWLNPKVATESDYKIQEKRVRSFLTEPKFLPEHLSKEYLRLIRKISLTFHEIVTEIEGEKIGNRFKKVDRKSRNFRDDFISADFEQLKKRVKNEPLEIRKKMAHYFRMLLEIQNICESVYRSWRINQRVFHFGAQRDVKITFSLTNTLKSEQDPAILEIFYELSKIMEEGIPNTSLLDEPKLKSKFRVLWLHMNRSNLLTERFHNQHSFLFSPATINHLLSELPSYKLSIDTVIDLSDAKIREALFDSRIKIIQIIKDKLVESKRDFLFLGSAGKKIVPPLDQLFKELDSLQSLRAGDGLRVKKWKMKFIKLYKSSELMVRHHDEFASIVRLLNIFPALLNPFVVKIKSNREIPNLLPILKLAGPLPHTNYIKRLIYPAADFLNHPKIEEMISIPHTLYIQSANDLKNGHKLIKSLMVRKNVDIVRRFWSSEVEVYIEDAMVKAEVGPFFCRQFIISQLFKMEQVLKSGGLKLKYRPGRETQILRSSGTIREQLDPLPKSLMSDIILSVDSHSITRSFLSEEMLANQLQNVSKELLYKRMRGRTRQKKSESFEKFLTFFRGHYQRALSKFPVELFHDRTRLYLLQWYGVGSAWKELNADEQKALREEFNRDTILIISVKEIGHHLAKSRPHIWPHYIERATPNQITLFMAEIKEEFELAKKFIFEMTGQKSLTAHKPWLVESIYLKSPPMNVLNVLQVIALKRGEDGVFLLSEIGLGSGMLTTA